MLLLYLLFIRKPLLLLIPYVLQVIPYFFITKKLGLKKWICLIPVVAEYQFAKKVFPKKRTFFRALIITLIFMAFAYYLHPTQGLGLIYAEICLVVYGLFLIRLYWRLSKAFGKKILFRIGTVFLPIVFLLILSLGKAEFTQPVFKPAKPHSKPVIILRRIGFVTVSIIEVIAITLTSGYFAMQKRLPAFVVDAYLDEEKEAVEGLEATGTNVTRETTLGDALDTVVSTNQSRDYYFADHSNDKDVVVFMYIIGSNLEDENAAASLNIAQMIDATEQGTHLKFVIQAGGSDRWFTKGIQNGTYGRYEIENGELTQVDSLSSSTNMATEEALADFLSWAHDSYNADRNMLILWDHGSGVGYGYGVDSVNGKPKQTISVSSIISALDQSNMKFDTIGFDACLMQDIELANALEPYADYFIASEETEPAYGWYYTPAFSALAKDPTISTEEFGSTLVASYDPYNRLFNDGYEDPDTTLSLVDLTLVKTAFNQYNQFMEMAAEEIKTNQESFADISLAAANAYDFYFLQLDLVGFLDILNEIDYDNSVYPQDQLDTLIQSLSACVICHNGDSAYGINGIAFAFPYNLIYYYTSTRNQLTALSATSEVKLFDEVFSIIAAQQKKEQGDTENSDNIITNIMNAINGEEDFTKEDWYIKGFEDYDNSTALVDIPLKEVENGYQIQLPDKTWNTIADVQTMVYQRVDESDAYTRYIGNDYLGGLDENGHSVVTYDTNWVHVNGQIVCYEADQVNITDDGEVYQGKIKARLNGEEDIYLVIQWDNVADGEQQQAHLLGYETVDDDESGALDDKGYSKLEAGDQLDFLFDYYDEEGNFVETRTAGDTVYVTSQDRIEVTDEKMDTCTIEFCGVLKDVYQRYMTTELIVMDVK